MLSIVAPQAASCMKTLDARAGMFRAPGLRSRAGSSRHTRRGREPPFVFAGAKGIDR